MGIMSSAIGLNICTITARITMHRSMIKKKKKDHDEIALLTKTNLDYIKGLSRSLTDSSIEHSYFNLIDVSRKYDYTKEEINKFEIS